MSNLDLAMLCAVGCGLVAGFFFGFSICVMKALGKLPPEQGIAAMQSIVPWDGRGLHVLDGHVTRERGRSARLVLLVGGLLYLVGTVLVTRLFNVPRNNALAILAPTSLEATELWVDYLSTWTAWNHVRTMAALASAVLFTIAVRLRHSRSLARASPRHELPRPASIYRGSKEPSEYGLDEFTS